MSVDKSIGERLKQIRMCTLPRMGDTYDIAMSLGEFAAFVGCSKAQISLIENGKSPITKRFEEKLEQNTLINIKWLKTGKGRPYRFPPGVIIDMVEVLFTIDHFFQILLSLGFPPQDADAPPILPLSLKAFEDCDLPPDANAAEKYLEMVQSLCDMYEGRLNRWEPSGLSIILNTLKSLASMMSSYVAYRCCDRHRHYRNCKNSRHCADYQRDESNTQSKSYMICKNEKKCKNHASYKSFTSFSHYTHEIDGVRDRLSTYLSLLYQNTEILGAINTPEELFKLDKRHTADWKELSLDDKLKVFDFIAQLP